MSIEALALREYGRASNILVYYPAVDWMMGDLDGHVGYAARLPAPRNALSWSVDYRMAPGRCVSGRFLAMRSPQCAGWCDPMPHAADLIPRAFRWGVTVRVVISPRPWQLALRDEGEDQAQVADSRLPGQVGLYDEAVPTMAVSRKMCF